MAIGAGSIGAIGAGISAAGNALNALSNLRSIDLPRAGEVVGDLMSAKAAFDDSTSSSHDWRVRMSLPTWPGFRDSPVLTPLRDAGGMIFPYTPVVVIKSSAKYTPINPVHSNFTFHAYQHSDPGTISITAPMNVEDNQQAMYWIAALHYFRSITKMFSGGDPKAGNPPPIVHLNGYGSYVLKEVPVVVTDFSTTLDAECDYIPVNVKTSFLGSIGAMAANISEASAALGGAIPSLGGVTNAVSGIADTVNSVAQIPVSLGMGGSKSGGIAYVPTKSTFTITLMPIYSRLNARKFSLDNFVAGGYLDSGIGYV